METIVNLAKRRGFVFQASELYGGLSGFWDWGPYGVELRNNIKAAWWKAVVQEHENVVGLDSAIIQNPKVWEASEHVEFFTDPMVDCRSCKLRFRADHVAELETTDLKKLSRALSGKPCPNCGEPTLTEPRFFNMMFKTFVGPVEESASTAYLRPETAQGIFVDFPLVMDVARKKLPFGIAQIGKAFRNEITPGDFVFRSREFEQMELEFFVKPGEAPRWFSYWKKARMAWHARYLRKENLRFRDHGKEEKAHYAKAATDIEYKFPMGWKELEGIANRGDFDLSQHQKVSGQDLGVFDEALNGKVIPYVIEPSLGVDRAALALFLDSYAEEEVKGETRAVLRLHPELAPITVAVLPLSKNPELSPLAKEVWAALSKHFRCEYDETQSIGKRYRRQDEIGTPFCVTVDFDSLKDKKVTVRDRDSMEQERIPIADLVAYFKK